MTKKTTPKPEKKIQDELDKTAGDDAAETAVSIVGSPAPEFRSLKTVEELVEAYNDMVPTALDVGIKKVSTVKLFVDVKTGVLACERLHSQIQKARETAEKPRTEKSATGETKMTKKAKAKKAKKAKKISGGKRLDVAKRIQVIAKENPCRKGTGRYNRVQKLLDSSGKTVEAFLAKGGRTGTVLYSARAGWIKLV